MIVCAWATTVGCPGLSSVMGFPVANSTLICRWRLAMSISIFFARFSIAQLARPVHGLFDTVPGDGWTEMAN